MNVRQRHESSQDLDTLVKQVEQADAIQSLMVEGRLMLGSMQEYLIARVEDLRHIEEDNERIPYGEKVQHQVIVVNEITMDIGDVYSHFLRMRGTIQKHRRGLKRRITR
jgi:hypothetical protein